MKLNRAALAVFLALLPGWIIPRIIGTIAVLAHPTPITVMALIGWWTLPPLGGLLLWLLKRRYGAVVVAQIKRRYGSQNFRRGI